MGGKAGPTYTYSRSDPDSKQKQKQVVYQSHSMCDICDCQKMSQFWICDLGYTLFSFLIFLAKQIWSRSGHKFKCDWCKHVSVSIEMVRNERNTAKYTRKWGLFQFSVWNLDRNGS